MAHGDDPTEVTEHRLEISASTVREAERDRAEVVGLGEQVCVRGPVGHGVDAEGAAQRDVTLPPDGEREAAPVEHLRDPISVHDGYRLIERDRTATHYEVAAEAPPIAG